MPCHAIPWSKSNFSWIIAINRNWSIHSLLFIFDRFKKWKKTKMTTTKMNKWVHILISNHNPTHKHTYQHIHTYKMRCSLFSIQTFLRDCILFIRLTHLAYANANADAFLFDLQGRITSRGKYFRTKQLFSYWPLIICQTLRRERRANQRINKTKNDVWSHGGS